MSNGSKFQELIKLNSPQLGEFESPSKTVDEDDYQQKMERFKEVFFKKSERNPGRIKDFVRAGLTGDIDPGPSIIENITSALAVGKDQIDESFWIKMQADAEKGIGLGSIMASTFGEDFLPGRIEENKLAIEENERQLLQQFERRPLQFSDAWNDPEYFFTFAIPEIVGQVAGLMGIPMATTVAGFVGGAAAGGGIGSIPASVIGSVIGMVAGTGISSYQEAASEAGGAIEQAVFEAQQKNPDMTQQELAQVREDAFNVSEKVFDRNMTWLLTTNSLQTAIAFLPGFNLASLTVRTATGALKRIAKTAVRFKQFRPRVASTLRFGANIAMEATEEGVQWIMGEDALNDMRDPEERQKFYFDDLKDNPEFIENLKAGGLMGAMFGGGAALIRAAAARRAKNFQQNDLKTLLDQQSHEKDQVILNAVTNGRGGALIRDLESEGGRERGIFSDREVKDVQERVKDSEKRAKKETDLIEQYDNEWSALQNDTDIVNEENRGLALYNVMSLIDFNSMAKEEKKKGDIQDEAEVAKMEQAIISLKDVNKRIRAGEDVYAKRKSIYNGMITAIETATPESVEIQKAPPKVVEPVKPSEPVVSNKEIQDLAQKISKGEKAITPVELQIQQNFPEQLEVELKSIREGDVTEARRVEHLALIEKKPVDIEAVNQLREKVRKDVVAGKTVAPEFLTQLELPTKAEILKKPKVVVPEVAIPPKPAKAPTGIKIVAKAVAEPEPTRDEIKLKEAKRAATITQKEVNDTLRSKKVLTDLTEPEIESLGFRDVSHLSNSVNEIVDPDTGIRRHGSAERIAPGDITVAQIKDTIKKRRAPKREEVKRLEAKIPTKEIEKKVPPVKAPPPKEAKKKPVEPTLAVEKVPEIKEAAEEVFGAPIRLVSTKPSKEEREQQAEVKKSIDDKIAEATADFKKKHGGKLLTGVDPEMYSDLLKVAVLYVEKGVRSAAEFAKKIGVKLTAEVRDAWNEAFLTTAAKNLSVAEKVNQMIREIPGLSYTEARETLVRHSRTIIEEIKASDKPVSGNAIKDRLRKLGNIGGNEKILTDHLVDNFKEDQLITLIATYGSLSVVPHISLIQTKQGWQIKVSSERSKKKEEKDRLIKQFRDNRANIERISKQKNIKVIEVLNAYKSQRKTLSDKWEGLRSQGQENSNEAIILKRQIIEKDLAMVASMTGISEWEAFLNNTLPEKSGYVEKFVNNELPEIKLKSGQVLTAFHTNPITQFLLELEKIGKGQVTLNSLEQNIAIGTSRTIRGKTTRRSQIDTLADALSQNVEGSTALDFSGTDLQKISTLIEDSMVSLRATDVTKIEKDDKVLQGNIIVEDHRDEKKSGIQIVFTDGLKGIGKRGDTAAENMNFEEVLFLMVKGFLDSSSVSNNKTDYMHYMGQFGDKDRIMFALYKKLDLQEAQKEANKLSKLNKGFPKNQSELGISDIAQSIERMIQKGWLKPNEVGDKIKLAKLFALNIAVNRFYSDQYFHGDQKNYVKGGQFRFISEFTKRLSSHISNGKRPLTNIEGGLPNKLNLAVIEDNKLFEGTEEEVDVPIPDGFTLYRNGLGKLMAKSFGSIILNKDKFDQEGLPFYKFLYSINNPDGSVTTIKSLWSEIQKEYAPWQENMKAIKKYMSNNNIDVLTFASSAKLRPGKGTPNDISVNPWKKGTFTPTVKPKVVEMDTNNLFAQTELRQDPNSHPSKHRVQFLRFLQLFPNSTEAIQNFINEVYEISTEKQLKRLGNATNDQKKVMLLNLVKDTPENQYLIDFIENIDFGMHPHTQNIFANMMISDMNRSTMEIKANGSLLTFQPDIDQGLEAMRVEDGETKPAQIHVPADSGYAVGQKGFLMRAPIDGFHSSPYVEIVGFLPKESGSQIMVDAVTARIAGWDYDGDQGFLWVPFTGDKLGRQQQAVNDIFDLVELEYKNEENFKRLTDPIDVAAIDKLIVEFKKDIEAVNKNTIKGHEAAYNVIKGGDPNIGILSRNIAVYLLASTAGIKSKNKFTFPKLKEGKDQGQYTELGDINTTDEILTNHKNVFNQNIDRIKLMGIEAMGLTPASVSMFSMLVSFGVSPEHLVSFFNSPLLKRFNTIYERNNGATSIKDREAIFLQMAQEVAGSDFKFAHDRHKVQSVTAKELVSDTNADKIKTIEYLRYLNTLSGYFAPLNQMIAFGEAMSNSKTANYQLKNILEKLTPDAEGKIKGLKGLEIGGLVESNKLVGAESALRMSKQYFGTFDVTQSSTGLKMLETVEQKLGNIKGFPDNRLNKAQSDAFYNGIRQLFYASALKDKEGQDIIKQRVNKRYTELIRSKEYADNEFLNVLFIEDDLLQVQDSKKSSSRDFVEISKLREDFAKLPQDFKDDSILYNFYEYGLTSSTGRGGFSIFFDQATHNNIVKKTVAEKDRWDNNKISDEELARLGNHLLLKNPILIPTVLRDFQLLTQRSSGVPSATYPKGKPVDTEAQPANAQLVKADGRFSVPTKFYPEFIAQVVTGKTLIYKKTKTDKNEPVYAMHRPEGEIDFNKRNIYEPFKEKQAQPKPNKTDDPKFMLKSDSEEEELASSDIELQQSIEKKFAKILPSVEVVIVTNWEHKGMPVLGAASGNTIFIDPTKSVQSTYFHEHAHIYWDSLPAKDSTKVKLIDMFETEEDAINAIGRTGTEIAEEAIKSFPGMIKAKFNKGKFLSLLKLFWKKIKKVFGIKDQDHYVRVMADRIWNNTDDIQVDTNVSSDYIKFQLDEIGTDIAKQQVQAAQDFYKKNGIDIKNLTVSDIRKLVKARSPEELDTNTFPLPNGVTIDNLTLEDLLMRYSNVEPQYKEDAKGNVAKIGGKAVLDEWTIEKYVDENGDQFNESSEIIVESIPELKGVKSIGKIVKGWTADEIAKKKATIRKEGGIIGQEWAMIEGYKRYLEDLIKVRAILDKLDTKTFFKLSKKEYSKVFNQLKGLEEGARKYVRNIVINQIYMTELMERIRDENTANLNLMPAATLALHSMVVSDRIVPMSKWMRLSTSPKDLKDKMAQLWFRMLASHHQNSQSQQRQADNSLKNLEKDIKDEDGNLDNMFEIIVDDAINNPSGEEFMIHPDSDKFKKLKKSEQAYISTYVKIKESYTSSHLWFNKQTKAYRNKILKADKIEGDFFEIMKTHGIWTAVKIKLTGSDRYDHITVKNEKTGEIKTLGEFKDDLDIEQANGVVAKSKALFQIKKLEQQAIQNLKNKRDANGTFLVNQVPETISVPGSNVPKEFASKNRSATLRNVLKAHINKRNMEPMIPYAIYFQNYFKGDTNENIRKLITNINNQILYKRSPDSFIGVWGELLQFGVNYTAYKMLALNFIAPIFNFSAGQAGNFIMLEPRHFLRGWLRLATKSRKTIAVMKELSVVSTSIDAEKSLSKEYWKRAENAFFFTTTWTEYLNQSISFVGMMKDSEFDAYDNNGKVIKGKEGLSAEREFMLHMANNKIHGAYGAIFRRELNLTPEGRAVSQFKGWLGETWLRNFGRERVDIFQQVEKGIARTWFDPKVYAHVIKNKSIKGLSPVDKTNLGRGVRSIMAYGLLYTLMLTLTDDDDDKVLIAGFTRAMGDVTYVFDYDNIRFLVASPIPVTSSIIDLWDTFDAMISQGTYVRDSKFGKAGDLRLTAKLFRTLPFSTVFKKVLEEASK